MNEIAKNILFLKYVLLSFTDKLESDKYYLTYKNCVMISEIVIGNQMFFNKMFYDNVICSMCF